MWSLFALGVAFQSGTIKHMDTCALLRLHGYGTPLPCLWTNEKSLRSLGPKLLLISELEGTEDFYLFFSSILMKRWIHLHILTYLFNDILVSRLKDFYCSDFITDD